VSRGVESARRRAREVAFRVAYQADMTTDGYAHVWDQLRAQERLSGDQSELVGAVVGALERGAADIDRILREAAEHWPLERLAATDRSVLRTAIAELTARPGTPVRVVLDEAIEIARRYGSEESGRFVNGVLDRIARRMRPEEF
jgi:N utilization substance protein B